MHFCQIETFLADAFSITVFCLCVCVCAHIFRASLTKCSIQTCSNAALAMTAYCYLHITLNKDQKLFHPCTAKFSDNSQCRVPVFDISHELPLCREHAWKRVSDLHRLNIWLE